MATSIREAIPEISVSIKTALIETCNERYAVVTEAAATAASTTIVVVATAAIVAARPQGGNSLLFHERNTETT